MQECAELLLKRNPDLIYVTDNNGWTAVHTAAYNNVYISIGTLLDVNRSVAYLLDKKYKKSAFHIAAYKGHEKVIEEIVRYLPDIWDSTDGNGQNILHIAVSQNQKSIINFIFRKIQRFDILNILFIQRDNEGATPLHLMARFQCHIPEVWEREWIRYSPEIKYFDVGPTPEVRERNQYIDKDVVDNANMTPAEVFYQEHNSTQSHEKLDGLKLDTTDGINTRWYDWNRGERGKAEVLETAKEKIMQYRQMANSHMIVAALITTVALTAGFAMPGGFDGNEGPNQGSPLLLQKPAFKMFVVADTVALLFSISSLFLYFSTSFQLRDGVIYNLLISAIVLNVVSVAALMVAFIAGTYAVLSHSLVLAISVCTLCSLFLILVFSLSFRISIHMFRFFILKIGFYLRRKYNNIRNNRRFQLFVIMLQPWRRGRRPASDFITTRTA